MKNVLANIFGKFSKSQPEVATAVAVTIPDGELRLNLGVKPGHKVCLFHAPKYLLPLFLKGDLKLTLDWVESDSDVILYWLQFQDDVIDIMVNLERMIKRNGRIWLIVPEVAAGQHGFTGNWEDARRGVLEATSLVDNKVIFLSRGERGTQFMSRKAAREEAAMENAAEPRE